ncbi:MAG: hypothetical protein N4Q26_02295 [Lactobacillus iners]|nr:hypothetical protein [Lactobacillus iners]
MAIAITVKYTEHIADVSDNTRNCKRGYAVCEFILVEYKYTSLK